MSWLDGFINIHVFDVGNFPLNGIEVLLSLLAQATQPIIAGPGQCAIAQILAFDHRVRANNLFSAQFCNLLSLYLHILFFHFTLIFQPALIK